MAGMPKRRERNRHRSATARATRRPSAVDHLESYYANQWSTFEALRTAMVQNGIVDHGVNPFDVIQRAIDDTTMDYLLIRKRIDQETHGDPQRLYEHHLYEFMEHVREAMVRYSTFAMQYDIQRRQLKLSESRVALLATTLKTVLTQMGLSQEQIQQAPRLLIAAIKAEEPEDVPTAVEKRKHLDPVKAEALAEILGNDAVIEIETLPEPTDPDSNGHAA